MMMMMICIYTTALKRLKFIVCDKLKQIWLPSAKHIRGAALIETELTIPTTFLNNRPTGGNDVLYLIALFWLSQNAQKILFFLISKNNECPGYDTKQSDGEIQVILELLGMQSTSL